MSDNAGQGTTMGGQLGTSGDMPNGMNGIDGGDNNALLAQQQALLGLTGGQGNFGAQGFDTSGDSRAALMNLLTRQSFGGGAMGAGMMGQMGGMGGMQMGMAGQQGFGGMAGFQGNQDDQNQQNAMMGMGAFGAQNTAFGGFAPAMGMMGMAPSMMGSMSALGQSNLLGTQNADGKGMGDGSGRGDAPQSNGMIAQQQQNMLLQQMLQQQAAGGGIWQQYGQMAPMMGADGGAGLANPYMSMLGGQGAAQGATTQPQAREAGEAGVLSLPDFAKSSGKKARPKKPKNKPKRPLSAYNIFFKDERAKILAGIPDKKEGEEEEDDEGKEKDGDKADNEDEKDTDGKKTVGKKRKRVPHGKIGFESLAKIVGQRWKELPPEELDTYKKRAEEDMKRYRKEMEAYVQKQREGLEQSREHLEKLVDEETKKRYFGDGSNGGV